MHYTHYTLHTMHYTHYRCSMYGVNGMKHKGARFGVDPYGSKLTAPLIIVNDTNCDGTLDLGGVCVCVCVCECVCVRESKNVYVSDCTPDYCEWYLHTYSYTHTHAMPRLRLRQSQMHHHDATRYLQQWRGTAERTADVCQQGMRVCVCDCVYVREIISVRVCV
jgi:hypothetical protein